MVQRLVYVTTFLIALIGNAVTPQEMVSNCWDGSYAYQVATLSTVGDRVEIGVTAGFWLISETTGQPIIDQSGLPITAKGRSNQSFYFSFASSECQTNEDSWECKASTEFSDWNITEKVFVQRLLTTIDGTISPITKVSVTDVTVTISPNGVRALISNANPRGETSTAVIEFGTGYCSHDGQYHNTHFGTAEFPQTLRDYLGDT